jgi:hypothetical protein
MARSFFFLFVGIVDGGGWWVAALVVIGSVWVGGHLFGCLIWCFVLILSLCIFLKMLRCQLVSSKQKNPHFMQ